MTHRSISDPGKSPSRSLGEQLAYLRRRIDECRRNAQACYNASVALALNEFADRLEAEAAILAAKVDLFARLQSNPS